MEPGVAIDLSVVLDYSEQAGVPLDYLKVALKEIDAVAYALEIQEFEAAKKYFGDHGEISPVILDAVENRIRAHKGRSIIRIQAMQQGSLEIVIPLGALFIWFLDKTVGETIKQAWTKSHLHEELKKLLMYRREQKAKDLGMKSADRINKKLGAAAKAHIVLVDPIGGPGHHRYKIQIQVDVRNLPDYPPPPETFFDTDPDTCPENPTEPQK